MFDKILRPEDAVFLMLVVVCWAVPMTLLYLEGRRRKK